MARIRSIKPSFFLNEDLAALSPLHRLLFQGLWVIADRAGRLTDKPKTIKAQVLPHDDCDVDAMLSDLAAGDDPFIVRYKVDGKSYIQVVNFLKHQNPHMKEAETEIPAFSGAKTQSPEITGQEPDKPRKGTDEPGGFGSGYGSGFGSGSGSDAPRQRPAPSNGTHYTTAENDAWAAETGVTLIPRGQIRKPRTGIDQSFRHRSCIGGGSWASCARGVCVPPNLARQWMDQGFDEAYCAKLTADYLDPITAGTPLESDGYRLWRGVWSAVHQPEVPRAPTAREKNTPMAVLERNWETTLAQFPSHADMMAEALADEQRKQDERAAQRLLKAGAR